MSAVNSGDRDIPPYGPCSIVGLEDAIGVNEPVLQVESPSALGGSVVLNGPGKLAPGRRGFVQIGDVGLARLDGLPDPDKHEIYSVPWFARQNNDSLMRGGSGNVGGAIGAYRLLGILSYPDDDDREVAVALVKRISECWIQRYSIQVLGAPLSGDFVLTFLYGDSGESPDTKDDVVVDINDTAETIQEAIQQLPGIGDGNVSVENGPLPWHELYITLGDTALTVSDILADGLNLAGGTRPMVVIDRVGC
jgi:hypothetical protein